MKHIPEKLLLSLQNGFCVPQIAQLSKALKEPSTTLQYNIKKLESENKIMGYQAIINQKLINRGFTTYLFIKLSSKDYIDPEEVANGLSQYNCIESCDVITGDYELLIKIHSKDTDEYYEFVKTILKKYHFQSTSSITSLAVFKTQFKVLSS